VIVPLNRALLAVTKDAAPVVTTGAAARVKTAVVARALLIANVHTVPVTPLQEPIQLLNALPAAGVAVTVTDEPAVNDALHPVVPAVPLVIVQLMPAGDDVTVPVPFPPPEMVNAKLAAVTVSVTGMVVGLFSATDDVTEMVAVYDPAARLARLGCTASDAGAVVELRFVVNQPVAPVPY
jgi:hypothetical protein